MARSIVGTFASLLFIWSCLTPTLTGATLSLEDRLQQLETTLQATVKQLQEKVVQLEDKVALVQATNVQLEVQIRENNEIRDDLISKVTQLEIKVQEQESILANLLLSKNNKETVVSTGSQSIPTIVNQSAVSVNGMPSSCGDLQMIGHTLNGFYSVIGNTTMETVYCDFTKLPTDAGFQKWIGYDDVKSAPVYFYVQRNTSMSEEIPSKTIISFEVEMLNVGNAMNLTSGKFTVPRAGIYFFSFTSFATFPQSVPEVFCIVDLYVNGVRTGMGGVEEANTSYGQSTPFVIESTLKLKSGDQVWIQFQESSDQTILYNDNGEHYTQFTGWLLEEEIVASL